jgi:type VI secretion system protein ImpE
MKADELFQSGRLDDAITEQVATVKKQPTDQDARHMLFVLLCFTGELERAEKQLDVLFGQDEQSRAGSSIYHALLGAEYERRKVFEQSSRPVLPPNAPAYAQLRVEALELLRAGDPKAAEVKLDQAVEQTPTFSGRLNGAPFEGLRDDDDVLASVFEIFAGGRYIWIPMDHVKSLELREPGSALDTLWRPARLQDVDGEVADIHLPILYPGSYRHQQQGVRLGRVTDWVEQGELCTGVGQHLFVAIRDGEREELSIQDVKSFEFDEAS